MDIITAGMFDAIREKLFGGLFEDLGLLMLAFKLVVLIFIVGFVRSRVSDSALVTLMTAGLGYIVLFQYWFIFGPMMFIYLFIIFGFSAILIDVAITKPWTKHAWTGEMPGGGGFGGGGGGAAEELEDTTGYGRQKELNEHRHQTSQLMKRMGGMH